MIRKLEIIRFSQTVIIILILSACTSPVNFRGGFENIQQTAETLNINIQNPPLSATPNQENTNSQNNTRIPNEKTSSPSLVIPVSSTPSFGNVPHNQAPCNLASSGIPLDISFPDETEVRPGQEFTKTWRLINAGSCRWTPVYTLVWFSGETFNSSPLIPLRTFVDQGQTLDISIDLVAPLDPGEYQGYWKLRSPDNQLFGIGPGGNAPFWVKIRVAEVETPTPQISPTTTPTSQVVVAGELDLKSGDAIDVDSGKLDGKDSDFALKLFNDNQFLFLPENGAKALVFGNEPPTEWECRLGILSSDSISLSRLDKDAYICYRSNLGLPGYLHLDSSEIDMKTVKVSFLTWFVP